MIARMLCCRKSPVVFLGTRLHRGVEELWTHSYLDPQISADEMSKYSKCGDAWPASLLRLKSFDDLHKLWYVCLKEKNLLISERWMHLQRNSTMRDHGRVKKIKMTMKRILTVLSRREIHGQCLFAKRILNSQIKREELEIQVFHLEEQILVLEHKIHRIKNPHSVIRSGFIATSEKYKSDLKNLQTQVSPLRAETTQLVAQDWRYYKKYSDLPGRVTSKKEFIKALKNRPLNYERFY